MLIDQRTYTTTSLSVIEKGYHFPGKNKSLSAPVTCQTITFNPSIITPNSLGGCVTALRYKLTGDTSYTTIPFPSAQNVDTSFLGLTLRFSVSGTTTKTETWILSGAPTFFNRHARIEFVIGSGAIYTARTYVLSCFRPGDTNINRINKIEVAQAGTYFASPVTLLHSPYRDYGKPSFSCEKIEMKVDAMDKTIALKFNLEFPLSLVIRNQAIALNMIAGSADIRVTFDKIIIDDVELDNVFVFLAVPIHCGYTLNGVQAEIPVKSSMVITSDGDFYDPTTILIGTGLNLDGTAPAVVRSVAIKSIDVRRTLFKDAFTTIDDEAFTRFNGRKLKCSIEFAPQLDSDIDAIVSQDDIWILAWCFKSDTGGYRRVVCTTIDEDIKYEGNSWAGRIRKYEFLDKTKTKN